MSNFSHGRQAEDAAARFLEAKGCRVLERNWRTRWCEIDIVAQRGQVVYLVEVKYRQNTTHGTGLDYITPKKLKQMQFAAAFWQASHPWSGAVHLSAIAVSGPRYLVTDAVADITV